MNREEGLKLLDQTGIMTIVRGIDRSAILNVAEALYEGGIRVMEVALNTVGAFYMIKDLNKQFGKKMFIGAGTVLDTNDAKAALEAGAAFFVAPNTDKRVIGYACEENVPVFPGAFTPTEIVRAWKAGATAIKLFPTSSLGIGYVKELMGPLGHIPMLAVGGVHADNAADYLRTGCRGIGVASAVLDLDAIREGRYEAVRERAALFSGRVREAIAAREASRE